MKEKSPFFHPQENMSYMSLASPGVSRSTFFLRTLGGPLAASFQAPHFQLQAIKCSPQDSKMTFIPSLPCEKDEETFSSLVSPSDTARLAWALEARACTQASVSHETGPLRSPAPSRRVTRYRQLRARTGAGTVPVLGWAFPFRLAEQSVRNKWNTALFTTGCIQTSNGSSR